MKDTRICTIAVCLLLLSGLGCRSREAPESVLREFPLSAAVETVNPEGVSFDPESPGASAGSLKITAAGPRVVELFRTGDVDVEDARLIYRARVKTQDVEGQVYLEMYCRFAGKGSFFSRGLDAPLTGTTGWTTVETPFFLKKGENPDDVALNLVFTGKGAAWMDDIRLLRAPLR